MLESAHNMLDRSKLPTDPLSQILDLVEMRCLVTGTLVAGGRWSRRLFQPDAIKFCAVTQGSCWAALGDGAPPQALEPGDVIIMSGKAAVTMASTPAATARAGRQIDRHDDDGNIQIGSGREFAMLGGQVQVDVTRQSLLLSVLPPVIHVRGAEAAALRWPLEQLQREMANPRSGAAMIADHLTRLLFVQSLRCHLERDNHGTTGWLSALGDDRIAPALALIHGDPAHGWTLAELAGRVAMSRTAFAVRFKSVVGVTPLGYVLDWRMQLARRDLERGHAVTVVARSLGYASDSTFSAAFLRRTGAPPGLYRKTGRA